MHSWVIVGFCNITWIIMYPFLYPKTIRETNEKKTWTLVIDLAARWVLAKGVSTLANLRKSKWRWDVVVSFHKSSHRCDRTLVLMASSMDKFDKIWINRSFGSLLIRSTASTRTPLSRASADNIDLSIDCH